MDISKMIFDPLKDGKSRLELIDHMGGDLAIINDARVSFNKVSTELKEKDINLINYLIEHNHSSPLRGTVFKFRVKAPLFVCRQWFKHIIASNHNDEQLGWNEKSFRYIEIKDENDFYIPTDFRQQSKGNKQKSDGVISAKDNEIAIRIYKKQCEDSWQTYHHLIDIGVGREQARGVLVPSVYTNWIWTCSLQALLHFINLRDADDAQLEIKLYAEAIKELISHIVPETLRCYGVNK